MSTWADYRVPVGQSYLQSSGSILRISLTLRKL